MRVIIVGSGVSGLIMGHCLLRAGIDDFVILERRPDPVEQHGGGIGFFPQSFRVLDQLGLLDDVQNLSEPLRRWVHMDPRGHVVSDDDLWDILTKNHGHPGFLVFLRRELMEVLYTRLPGRESRVLTNKKVVGLEEDVSCVTVRCADGSVFTGDMVIGCDGVHSAIRRFTAGEGGDAMAPSQSEYQGLFGYGPRLDGIPPCDLTEVHDKDVNFMILSTRDKSFWLVTHLKDEAASGGRKYSAEDAQALADRYALHPVSWGGKVTFGDLWRTRSPSNSGLYDLMEGVASRWYRGRVVTLGDAAHDMTPNLGMAGNNAVESAASLTNKLHALLREKPSPTTGELQAAFAGYQKEREGRAAFCSWLSGRYCRWASWRTWLGRWIQSRLFPLLGDGVLVKYLISPWVRASVKLDFVKEKHLPPGAVPWKYA